MKYLTYRFMGISPEKKFYINNYKHEIIVFYLPKLLLKKRTLFSIIKANFGKILR